jgi:peroxiredoxin
MSMAGKRIKTGDAAPSIQVVNADGETIELSSLWADKPVVLAFLRHFG